MERIHQIGAQMRGSLAKNGRYATLSFLFILLFVNLFQKLFGAENSIVGVIFTIMMSASMVRDLTAAPVRHLCIQTGVLFLMTAAACLVSNASPWIALPVNFAMIFVILYGFTYEYVSHLYFPYILSYLFLVFISPVTPDQLPKRLLGVFVGAVSIILYQMVNGRGRMVETAQDVLTTMIDEADGCIQSLRAGTAVSRNPEQLRSTLCRLSKIIYDRRKRVLCISDASFAMLDTGRGLENLILLLYEVEGKPATATRTALLDRTAAWLTRFRAFTRQETTEIPPLNRADFGPPEEETARMFGCLSYIRLHMLRMTCPGTQKHYRKTLLSFYVRLKAALHVSPVRVVYALRVACLLALCTLAVQLLALPHGKWLLFTVASVSLPYADDVGAKAKKRMLATLIGAGCSVVLFSLVPSVTGRTLIMMLSGYLSFYFSDYSATFACSTIGALGGAVFMNAFGWGQVGRMSLIRLEYIVAGVLIALLANRAILPFRRETATRQLFKRYFATTELLTRVCRRQEVDPQLYYDLVIQAHLQEEKLRQNAEALGWTGHSGLLEKCRTAVRMAHRNQADALISQQ